MPDKGQNKRAVQALLKLVKDTYRVTGLQLNPGELEAVERYGNNLLRRNSSIKGPGMTQRWPVSDLSIKVNLLKGVISCRQRPTPEELEDMERRWESEHSGRMTQQMQMDALEIIHKEPRLMLLGKPGTGKTTMLKFLAVQALRGKLRPLKLMPLLVNLQDWKTEDLLEFLACQLSGSGFSKSSAKQFLKNMLKQGRMLILLDDLNQAGDGLRYTTVQQQICKLAQQYGKSRFLVTRRIATDSNSESFKQFANAEVTEFDESQVTYFVRYWFRKDKQIAKDWLEELKKHIQDRAINPLLLTLLCRVLEEDSPKRPLSDADLFQDGLKILLKEWDQKLGSRGMELYRKLSVKGKLRLLSRIARGFFEKNQSFFLRSELEEQIGEFFLGAKKSALKPPDVLRAIEVHHGIIVERSKDIFSFSHLSFQEYLTAWRIKEEIIEQQQQFSRHPSVSERMLSSISGLLHLPEHKKHELRSEMHKLVNHLTELRWREIFLMISQLLPQKKADQLLLLMKQHTDTIVAENHKLQRLLIWANDKAASVETSNHPAAVRGFYLALDRALARAFTRAFVNARALDPATACDPVIESALNFVLDPAAEPDANRHALALDLSLDLALALEANIDLADKLVFDLPNLGHSYNLAEDIGLPKLAEELQRLRKKCPDPEKNRTDWQIWEGKMRRLMLWYRNLGHNFGLEQEDNQQLKTYLYASKLIAACLHRSTKISQKTRQQILDSLLLPNKTK